MRKTTGVCTAVGVNTGLQVLPQLLASPAAARRDGSLFLVTKWEHINADSCPVKGGVTACYTIVPSADRAGNE